LGLFSRTRSTVIALISVIVIVFLIGVAGYFYVQYQRLTQPNADVLAITDRISKYYDLPQESPSLTSVTDVSKLTAQSFFARAQNGDKVLIYSKAGIAILYRPGDGKIVNIAPTQAVSAVQAPATPSATPKKK
jgi:hypothetical protein